MNHSAEIGEIAERLPYTLELVGLALLLTIAFGAGYGFVRARVRTPVVREIIAVPGLLFRSTPVALAISLQLFLWYWVRLPLFGFGAGTGFRDHLGNLLQPLLALAIPFGAWSSVLFDDHVRAPRAAPAPAPSILVPVARTVAWIGPAILGASLFIEPMYAWPGISRALSSAMRDHDAGVAATVLLTYAVVGVLLAFCTKLVPSDSAVYPPRHTLRLSGGGTVALAVLVVGVIGGLAANLVAPVGPYFIDQVHWQGYPLAPGAGGHPLGTDENGRDLLARLLVGLRVSLGIAVAGALVASAIGAAVAKSTPRLRWFSDRRALRVAGIRSFAALPFILVAITVLSNGLSTRVALQPLWIALLIGAFSWPVIAPAFRSLGAASLGRFVGLIGSSLLLEVTVSFFGYGVQPPEPSLGNLLFNAQTMVTIAPWAVIVPTVAIIVMLGALYALADDLRERDTSA